MRRPEAAKCGIRRPRRPSPITDEHLTRLSFSPILNVLFKRTLQKQKLPFLSQTQTQFETRSDTKKVSFSLQGK